MKDLITASEAALEQLKHLHRHVNERCPGICNCATLSAIASLEAEIAKAKRESGEIVAAWPYPMEHQDPGPDFHATGPFKIDDVTPKMVNPPPATIDSDDAAHAAIRASQQIGARFMPATRLCVECDTILQSTTAITTNRCERCQA